MAANLQHLSAVLDALSRLGYLNVQDKPSDFGLAKVKYFFSCMLLGLFSSCPSLTYGHQQHFLEKKKKSIFFSKISIFFLLLSPTHEAGLSGRRRNASAATFFSYCVNRKDNKSFFSLLLFYPTAVKAILVAILGLQTWSQILLSTGCPSISSPYLRRRGILVG